jgi:hypothetical protein
MVLPLVALCLAASSSAVAATGSRSSTRTIVAGASHEPLAQQAEDDEGEGARVGEGRRVKVGQLPATGRITAQWIALAVVSVVVGAAFVSAATPTGYTWSLLTPLRARLVRAASCGYPLEARIFDLERTRSRSD